MIKSLQSKMILVMFIFMLIVFLFAAFISILRMEDVYFRGFVEEMLNTISSFGIATGGPQDNPNIDSNKEIEKLIANFNIYFAINNVNRTGIILDNDNNIIYSSNDVDTLSGDLLNLINEYNPEDMQENQMLNSSKDNKYYFVYYLRDFKTNELQNTIIVSQDKTYINGQLRNMIIFYGTSIVVISVITVLVSILLASNVTKPIEIIRKKAQKIAARR